jgi:hypothetical protein
MRQRNAASVSRYTIPEALRLMPPQTQEKCLYFRGRWVGVYT